MNFFPFQFQNVVVFTKLLICIYFRTKYSCRLIGQKSKQKNLNLTAKFLVEINAELGKKKKENYSLGVKRSNKKTKALVNYLNSK